MKTSIVHVVSLFLLLTWFSCSSDGYRPIIIIHGLFEGPKHFRNLTTFIQMAHPGTEINIIDLYSYKLSLWPLWKQVKDFRAAIEPIMNRSDKGVHLICYSQGGVICRALLSVIPNHNVHTFIALSSPLTGQYGDTKYVNKVFPSCLKKDVYMLCYWTLGQDVSICQYWNDPHHRDLYVKYSNFLALLNGDKEHKDMNAWRDNFLRLEKLVLIGGPDDKVITPWQSSIFGFYNSNETVVEMRNQEYYVKDLFGLKTLDSRGDISVCVLSGVPHTSWPSNYTVFRSCIQEWLT